jgi:hypothetical protein
LAAGRLDLGHLLCDLLICVIVSSCEDESDRFGREVAAADEPLVLLFDAEHPGEPDQAAVVGHAAKGDWDAIKELADNGSIKVDGLVLVSRRGDGTSTLTTTCIRPPRALAGARSAAWWSE